MEDLVINLFAGEQTLAALWRAVDKAQSLRFDSRGFNHVFRLEGLGCKNYGKCDLITLDCQGHKIPSSVTSIERNVDNAVRLFLGARVEIGNLYAARSRAFAARDRALRFNHAFHNPYPNLISTDRKKIVLNRDQLNLFYCRGLGKTFTDPFDWPENGGATGVQGP